MTLKELQPQLLNLSPSIFLHHWRDIWEELKRMGKSAIARIKVIMDAKKIKFQP